MEIKSFERERYFLKLKARAAQQRSLSAAVRGRPFLRAASSKTSYGLVVRERTRVRTHRAAMEQRGFAVLVGRRERVFPPGLRPEQLLSGGVGLQPEWRQRLELAGRVWPAR